MHCCGSFLFSIARFYSLSLTAFFFFLSTPGQSKDADARDKSKSKVSEARLRVRLTERIQPPIVYRRDVSVLTDLLPKKREFLVTLRAQKAHHKIERAARAAMSGEFLNKVSKLTVIENDPELVWREAESRQRDEEKRKPRNGNKEVDGKEQTTFKDLRDHMGSRSTPLSRPPAGSFSNKVNFVKFLVEESALVGDKVVVFSNSVPTVHLLRDVIADIPQGPAVHVLTGETSSRDETLQQFREASQGGVLVSTIQVGSMGINLTCANRVVIFDIDFNPMYNAQAACRVFRYGQAKETFIYNIVTQGMISTQLYKRAYTKKRLAQSVIDGKGGQRRYNELEQQWFGEADDNEGFEADGREFEEDPVLSRCLERVSARDQELAEGQSMLIGITMTTSLLDPDPEEQLTVEEQREVQGETWEDSANTGPGSGASKPLRLWTIEELRAQPEEMLRRLIEEHGGVHVDCTEKGALVQRASEAALASRASFSSSLSASRSAVEEGVSVLNPEVPLWSSGGQQQPQAQQQQQAPWQAQQQQQATWQAQPQQQAQAQTQAQAHALNQPQVMMPGAQHQDAAAQYQPNDHLQHSQQHPQYQLQEQAPVLHHPELLQAIAQQRGQQEQQQQPLQASSAAAGVSRTSATLDMLDGMVESKQGTGG